MTEVKAPTKNANREIPRIHNPVHHLAYRFVGLARFRLAVSPPENMAWLVLYMHQLMFEAIAFQYPDKVGMSGRSKQQIQTAVNEEIKALSKLKFGAALSKNDRTNNKVHLLYSSANNF
jgi:hypothetical protein